jgi:membrane fusion protein (multidrug efflux system)
MSPRFLTATRTALAIACAAMVLAACGKPPLAAGSAALNAPTVSVATLQPQNLALSTELPGRTSAYQIAEVRPQVGGLIKARLFREGSDVKAGDVLYQIDAASYQAAYGNAQAALAKAEANLVSTRAKAERYKELAAIQAVSQQPTMPLCRARETRNTRARSRL